MTHSASVDLEGWLAAARAGSATAWGRLLEHYRAYLVLLARVQIGRRLRGKADAQDLVQETFLLAHRHLAEFRGRSAGELAAWLRRVLASRLARLVRHYCGTAARDVRLERELAAALDQSSQALDQGFVGGSSSPSERAMRQEASLAVAQALDRLPAHYREVLILRNIEGLTFPEVAERMGRSVDSVEKLWARALPRLRAALGDLP